MCDHLPMEPPRLTVGPLVNNHLLWATRVPCICGGGGGGGRNDFHRLYSLVGNHLARIVGSLDLYWLGFRRRIWFRQYPGDSLIILESLTGKYLNLQRKSLLRKSSLFRQSNAGEKLTTGKQTKRRIEPVPGRQIVDCWASLLPPTPPRLLFFLLTSLHAVPTIWIPGAG